MRRTWADLTDYPELFRDTYWGGSPADMACAPVYQIAANRNRFAAKHRLKTRYNNAALYDFKEQIGHHVGDHPEAYKTDRGEIVLIFSPYGKIRTCELSPIMIAVGFKTTVKLYRPDATTLMVKYGTLGQLKMATRCLRAFRNKISDRVGLSSVPTGV